MADTPAAGAANPPPTGSETDWPVLATDRVVEGVAWVRENVTDRATVAVRALVFALPILLVVGFVGVIALVLGVRVLHLLLEAAGLSWPRAVWTSYVGLGVLFLLAGSLFFRKGNRAVTAPDPAN